MWCVAPAATKCHSFLFSLSLSPCFSPPTHNREPYDTQLSDTIATHPSVEPMPLRPQFYTIYANVSLRGPRSASRPAHRPVRAYARSARRPAPAWYW